MNINNLHARLIIEALTSRPFADDGEGNFDMDKDEEVMINIVEKYLNKNVAFSDESIKDLVALIHNDSGHHTYRVGLQQSVIDAIKLIKKTKPIHTNGQSKTTTP